MRLFIIILLSGILLTSCSSKKITAVSYLNVTEIKTEDTPTLNVFVPRNNKKAPYPILIFVHGGNWNSGRKGTYDLLGRNFARKGVLTIIPDYTLSPNADYDAMTKQIATVIQWVKTNCTTFNGNAGQIYITGHSAGGHLGALAVMNPKYGIDPKSIAGIILNDAAGLDMKNYLEQDPPTSLNNYLTTWTNSPANWRDASPIYFVDKNTPPFLIYLGDKTYPSITIGNNRFVDALQPFQSKVSLIHLNKKHVPMVTQYFWPWSNRFDEVIEFMKLHKDY